MEKGLRNLLWLAPLLLAAAWVSAIAAPPDGPASQPAWRADIAKALEEAKRLQKPILVRAGAQWCPWCAKQETTLEDPRLRQELARWVLVYVDTDRSPEQGRRLGINGVPAFRILTPFGSQVAGTDGYQAAASLLSWLQGSYDQAAVSTVSFAEDEAPDDGTVAQMIARFSTRDAMLREAVIRRLLPYPQVAAGPVVEAFTRGTLAARLTALELLKSWQAPIGALDPWDPKTLDGEAMNALGSWRPDVERIRAATTQALAADVAAGARRELDKLVQTASENEAQAIRERLARHGEALLPEVYSRLARTTADRDRERLTALRYRLLASNRLALAWPGGLERLASLDAAERVQAVEELTGRATAGDTRLLTELFSSADPLVREMALRSLDSVGGQQAQQAVVRLLNDPDPNVRAAVLKQLAQKPSPALVPQIEAFLDKEKDPDLVVHAVRVLRETGGAAALKCLLPMLKHASWRVRAETAEAVGQCAQADRGVTEEVKAEAYAALIERLNDPDGFVISRAVSGLARADIVAAVKPLSEIAASHPDLAMAAIEGMTASSQMQAAAVPYLRKLAAHQDPAVRAAAITHLRSVASDGAQVEVLAGLVDAAAPVRIAAAGALLDVLESQRPGDDEMRQTANYRSETTSSVLTGLAWLLVGPTAGAPASRKAPASSPATAPSAQSRYEEWLADFQRVQGRPPWVRQALEPLEKMLSAQDPRERVAAATPLVAMGRIDKALPILLAAVEADPSLQSAAARILPWLPWNKRSEVYTRLMGRSDSLEMTVRVAQSLTSVPDERAAEQVWLLLGREDMTVPLASQLLETLRKIYLGERYYQPDSIPVSQRNRIAAVLRGKAESGPPLQRVVAMILLASVSKPDAAGLAETLYNDPAADAALRQDAFEVLMLTQTRAKREALAIAGLDSPQPEIRRSALSSLAMDDESTRMLRSGLPLFVMSEPRISFGSDSTPAVPQPPAGLTAERLRPLLSSPDPKTAAQAGYLLVLLKDPAGMEPLLNLWSGLPKGQRDYETHQWRPLVYRAIAVSNEDKNVPVLTAMYESMKDEQYLVREFYWTIRVMTGPAALELRKRIRSEIGMNNLR